jgi:hypothetical protein
MLGEEVQATFGGRYRQRPSGSPSSCLWSIPTSPAALEPGNAERRKIITVLRRKIIAG